MIKINQFELENVKRIKAVKMQPSASGLTVIGGKNNQGKTSVLDAIAWALGGERFRPEEPARSGSVLPPSLKVSLSNGIVVERKGKNSALTVTDSNGQRSGQSLLDDFISKLALDLPKFLNASGKEKADILLQIIGVGEQLAQLTHDEMSKYNERLAIGRIADQKAKFAKEMETYPEAPEELVSPSELILRQQSILLKNAENRRQREQLSALEKDAEEYRKQLEAITAKLNMTEAMIVQGRKTVSQLVDENTSEIEESLRDIEEINRKVRANLDHEKADEDAKQYKVQYDTLSAEIEGIRSAKISLLNGAQLPLPGLSVNDSHELTYNGLPWGNLSSSQQLKIATAIVRKLNPECGFVLMDKLEQMDYDTLAEFGAWLENEGLQVIATRVSTGSECSIIIEDGYAADETASQPTVDEGSDDIWSI